ncbi:hypothetical protein [Lysinibacillus sp. NPDC092081]|uniref:hypothetical protein n=1 Tax=Lysinibacillus sp. NPDC092081 TaxID=3364131 RepID=UPI00382B41B3
MRKRNGIPIDIPGARNQAPMVKTKKPSEYNQYNVYVTMYKCDGGQKIWTMVPLMHPDFKELKKAGYRITEKWDKREATA